MGDDLGCNNIQETWREGSPAKLPNQYDKVKVSERRPFIFIFRLNVVLSDSYQTDKIVIWMEIEKWKQKVPDEGVGDISSILKKLYYMNFPYVAAVWI